ncbi:MAG: alkaline phosphatase [Bernardetiaceae bacterium]
MFRWTYLSLLCFWFMGCSQNTVPQTDTRTTDRPLNVILLIGDGMGVTQVSSLFFFGVEEPQFLRFPYTGLSRTSSASHKITDSAAGAVAFASGIKTYNGAIGLDTNQQAVPTIIERIAPKGKKSGLVATSSITHATPAAFYAHAKSRNEHEKIAMDLVNSRVDFFAGGGIRYFARRKDGQNLIEALQKRSFSVDTLTHDAWQRPQSLDGKQRYAYLVGEKELPPKPEGRGDFLPEATAAALDYLSQHKEGFFLMVEGSQIDWGGHAADVNYVTSEMIDFDQTLRVALDFAEKDQNTLVIVTADHETGGFSLCPPLIRKQWDYNIIKGGFYEGANQVPSSAHTATMVPVFAYGPSAHLFTGVYHNNEIFHKILKATGW